MPEAPRISLPDLTSVANLRVYLAERGFQLRTGYNESLSRLRPIKTQLAPTDSLINKIVYRLYGLTEQEIALVKDTG